MTRLEKAFREFRGAIIVVFCVCGILWFITTLAAIFVAAAIGS